MAKSGKADVESEEEDNTNSKNPAVIKPASYSAVNTISKPVKATTPISILIESLVKNLCAVYERDDKQANKIYNFICERLFEMKLIDESYRMIEFEGMRNQYQRALYHLVSSAGDGKPPVPIQPLWPNNDITTEWSHYYREFDEVEYIAGGGFGQVFRVKNKLDGTEYAVKKICIRSEGIQSIMNYLSEVKTFASLNHSNIVQYKAAWLELGSQASKHTIIDQSESDFSYTEEEDSVIHENVYDYIYPKIISDTETSFDNIKQADDSSEFQVRFENSVKAHHYSYSHNNLPSTKNIRKHNREKRNSISEGGNAICKIEEIQNLQVKARHNPQWATLFIQMSLCQLTLKQWLEKRNSADNAQDINACAIVSVKSKQVRNDTVMEILQQLLKGIEYIHSKGIVHHDIKPSNIFIQLENGQLGVQLGDFGLACPLQSAHHSLAFGTKLYAAPEQLSGNCDPKSDMYSLGIVLLELAESFGTDMERVNTIVELRKGNLSSQLLAQQPQLATIISQLVTTYSADRPDASTLLNRISVKVDESELVRSLRSELAEKNEEIIRLRTLLAGFTKM